MCFVDFKKAFDSISHDKFRVTMMDMGYPLHLIDLLAKLYKKQLAKVKVAGTRLERCRVKKGCVLFPCLFNILAEMVMRETLDGFQRGLQIGSAKVKVAGTRLERCRVKKGCVLSPCLFNILAKIVMRETLDGFQGGLQIGGRMIKDPRYADDIILLATSEA